MEFYTTKELCCLLSCSAQSINNYVKQGKLPKPLKMGKENKWPKTVIEKLIMDKYKA